jgi:hypothetical protein
MRRYSVSSANILAHAAPFRCRESRTTSPRLWLARLCHRAPGGNRELVPLVSWPRFPRDALSLPRSERRGNLLRGMGPHGHEDYCRPLPSRFYRRASRARCYLSGCHLAACSASARCMAMRIVAIIRSALSHMAYSLSASSRVDLGILFPDH